MARELGTLNRAAPQGLFWGAALHGTVVVLLLAAACSGQSGEDPAANLRHDSKGIATVGPAGSSEPGAKATTLSPRPRMPRFAPSAMNYNSGVVRACNRFLALAAGEVGSASGLLGTPFLHDGRKLLQSSVETDAFANELSARAKRGAMVLSLLELKCCPGSVEKSALLEWFGIGLTNQRAEALLQHTQKISGAWFCVMTVGRATGETVKTEEIFVGVAPTGSDGDWQVVGFMD